jgi:hypothetical protein
MDLQVRRVAGQHAGGRLRQTAAPAALRPPGSPRVAGQACSPARAQQGSRCGSLPRNRTRQAMDRAHRIGQKKEVQVFRFCIENSIEEKASGRGRHARAHLRSSCSSAPQGPTPDAPGQPSRATPLAPLRLGALAPRHVPTCPSPPRPTCAVQVIEKAYKKLRLDALVIQQGRLTENQATKVRAAPGAAAAVHAQDGTSPRGPRRASRHRDPASPPSRLRGSKAGLARVAPPLSSCRPPLPIPR